MFENVWRDRPSFTLIGALALVVALTGVVAGGAQAAKPGNSENAKACQKGGWQDLVRSDGSIFANQGECVSYGAKGGTLRPYPYTPAQQICEAAGATFTVGNETDGFIWQCAPGPFDATEDAALMAECFGLPGNQAASSGTAGFVCRAQSA